MEQWTDERLDKLAELAERNSLAIEKLTAYQQASQWVVNLACLVIIGNRHDYDYCFRCCTALTYSPS